MPLLTAILLVASAAPAQPEGDGYEDRLVTWALALHARELEPNPDGKSVEEVLIASEDVFAPSDPYPLFLNALHSRTREAVIRREVLLTPGQAWDQDRALETERNLRRLFVLAVVKVVPVQGRAGGVALLVATKDRWSLRLSNAFTLIGPLLQYLQLQLVEVNFNGWGQQLAINTTVRLDTFSVGQSFIERRLLGTSWYLGETASLIFNRSTGALEGTVGEVKVGQPLTSLDQQWAFVIDCSWNSRRRRIFRGATVWQLPYPDEASGETVPFVYDVREAGAEATLTRSFGRAVKVDVLAALGGYVRQYKPALPPGERADWLIQNYLPRSENATYATLYLSVFPSDFKILKNIDTFELSEDFQLGWAAEGGVRWAFPTPLAVASFIELGAALRYRLYRSDDLLTLSVAGAIRVQPGRELANNRLAAEIINYSPSLWGGRLVTRLLLDFNVNDLDHRRQLLGGSTGLRGAYPEQLSGRHLILGNFEYRARAFELWSNWLGLVFFYDLGSAFDSTAQLTHSIGFGLRLLLSQFNREVLRLDFGVIIGGPTPGVDRLNATWGQVTDIRPTFLDHPLQ